MSKAEELAALILKQAPFAVSAAKRCVNENYDLSRTEGLALENELFAECFATEDQKTRMDNFLHKK